MGKTKQALVRILLAIIVWAFLMPLLPWILGTITDYLVYNNLTKVDIPIQRFNVSSGSWYQDTYRIDLGGLLSALIVIIVFLAPIFVILSVVRS